MKTELPLEIDSLNHGRRQILFPVERVFNAGWAASNRAALDHHIDELRSLGVSPPRHVPTLYALCSYLATTSTSVPVHGAETSGEVEYVLLWFQGELFVTVGSDHTDRQLESFSIPKAKNACANVIAPRVWRFDEVAEHFDRLQLRSHVHRGASTELYQRDVCGALLQPSYWLDDVVRRAGGLTHGLVFFSGTIGTEKGLIAGDGYTVEMTDPVANRTITHTYRCEALTGAIEDF